MYSISRPARSPAAQATCPPKASTSKTGGTTKGSSKSKGVSGIKPKEEKLAGYLLARAAMHRKVEGPALNNLRAGHETVQQVDELLPLGRANVIQDLEKAKDEHLFLRKSATGQLVEDLLENHRRTVGQVTEEESSGAIAAATQYAKTGTCGGIATSITALHGAKLADMKDTRAVVAYAEHTTIDHTWSEWMPKGTYPDETPIFHGKDVIMDGWCKEKVAILREDSHFARLDKDGKADHLNHEDILDHVTGPEALKAVEKYKALIENSPVFQDAFNSYFQRLVNMNPELPKALLWNETSVFHTDFRKQAGKALHKDAQQTKRVSLAEIQAVGVARSLGSNVRGAIADAPGIIASATDMFPRPESKKRKRDEAGLRLIRPRTGPE